MKDARFGNPVRGEPRHPLPIHVILPAAPPQRSPPEINEVEAEGGKRPTIGRRGVIVEVSGDDLLQPFPPGPRIKSGDDPGI